jgi:hypothetical protein
MIINLRGANGSGKSTAVRSLIDPGAELRQITDTVPGYVSEAGICVLGKYTTDCGGMDTVKTQVAARAAVWEAADRYPVVVFEGILISTIYGPWLTLSQELSLEHGEGIRWMYLDTPFDVCLDRVLDRNGYKPFDVELLRNKIKSIESTRLKAIADGETVQTLDYTRAPALLQEYARCN